MKFFTPYLLSLVLPAIAFAQPPSGPPGPAITFDKSSVSVAGVSPKGQAVLFSVAREISEDDVATVVRRSQVLADDDGDGVVKLDLGRDVPFRSVWVAVDLATGQVAAAAPEGYPLRRVNWRGAGIVRGNSGRHGDGRRAFREDGILLRSQHRFPAAHPQAGLRHAIAAGERMPPLVSCIPGRANQWSLTTSPEKLSMLAG